MSVPDTWGSGGSTWELTGCLNARLQRVAVAGNIVLKSEGKDSGGIKNFYQETVILNTCHC